MKTTKRIVAMFLASVMCLSLCACNGDSNVEKIAVGETASTDLADFTLDNCQFTYHVNNTIAGGEDTFLLPTDEPNGSFDASIGYCYVSLTFTITNKDRGGHINFCGIDDLDPDQWNPNFTLSYNGTDYHVNGYDIHDREGSEDFSLHYAVITDQETGERTYPETVNRLIYDGQTIKIRTFGVINLEPEELTDGFDISVDVLNSKGEYETFVYTVPARA